MTEKLTCDFDLPEADLADVDFDKALAINAMLMNNVDKLMKSGQMVNKIILPFIIRNIKKTK